VPTQPVPTQPAESTRPNEYAQEYLDRGADRIGLHVYPEPADPSGPVVVIWPAMGTPARYYRPLAANLRAHGLGVVVADLRGTGSSTPRASRRSHYGYAELAGDVGAVQQALKPRLDGRRSLLLGHSLGGQAALVHLALAEQAGERSTVDALVLVAVGLPYFRAYAPGTAAVVLPYTQAIAATAALFGVWPGWSFGGRQARGVMRDWGYTARHGRYPRMDGADVESALRSLTTRVLAVSVDNDRYTPPATTDHLVAKLAAAPVVRDHYTAAQAGAALDHFSWVRASAALAARIAEYAAPR
jgi:predicted alpha/beta hydrolase